MLVINTRKRKRATSPTNEETAQVPGGLRLPVVQQGGSTDKKEKDDKFPSRTESLPVNAAPCAAKACPRPNRTSSGSFGPAAKSRPVAFMMERTSVEPGVANEKRKSRSPLGRGKTEKTAGLRPAVGPTEQRHKELISMAEYGKRLRPIGPNGVGTNRAGSLYSSLGAWSYESYLAKIVAEAESAADPGLPVWGSEETKHINSEINDQARWDGLQNERYDRSILRFVDANYASWGKVYGSEEPYTQNAFGLQNST